MINIIFLRDFILCIVKIYIENKLILSESLYKKNLYQCNPKFYIYIIKLLLSNRLKCG